VRGVLGPYHHVARPTVPKSERNAVKARPLRHANRADERNRGRAADPESGASAARERLGRQRVDGSAARFACAAIRAVRLDVDEEGATEESEPGTQAKDTQPVAGQLRRPSRKERSRSARCRPGERRRKLQSRPIVVSRFPDRVSQMSRRKGRSSARGGLVRVDLL
jgi:hypothetical protein